jgi:hypothetical protein
MDRLSLWWGTRVDQKMEIVCEAQESLSRFRENLISEGFMGESKDTEDLSVLSRAIQLSEQYLTLLKAEATAWADVNEVYVKRDVAANLLSQRTNATGKTISSHEPEGQGTVTEAGEGTNNSNREEEEELFEECLHLGPFQTVIEQ